MYLPQVNISFLSGPTGQLTMYHTILPQSSQILPYQMLLLSTTKSPVHLGQIPQNSLLC